MEIIVSKDYEEMSRKAAELAADSIRENPESLVSFPAGDTPLGMFHAFTDMVNAGTVDISKARYVSLDEWIGLSHQDKGSCGLFLDENLIGRLKKPFAETHIIDGAAADMENERQLLDRFIETHGPLEVSVLGIGMNGHLGFNEDGVDFELSAHIIPLSETTKQVMTKYFGDQFHPEFGLSQGISQIMAAKKVILIANGPHKAEIIGRAVKGEITNKVPASVLQSHPNCYVVVDQAAAAKL